MRPSQVSSGCRFLGIRALRILHLSFRSRCVGVTYASKWLRNPFSRPLWDHLKYLHKRGPHNSSTPGSLQLVWRGVLQAASTARQMSAADAQEIVGQRHSVCRSEKECHINTEMVRLLEVSTAKPPIGKTLIACKHIAGCGKVHVSWCSFGSSALSTCLKKKQSPTTRMQGYLDGFGIPEIHNLFQSFLPEGRHLKVAGN